MYNSRVSSIKRGQKESFIRKHMSMLLQQLAIEHASLRGLTVSRVQLSDKKSVAVIYLYTPEGEQVFQQKLDELKLFKPSMRKALAEQMIGRYVPEIIFRFDRTVEKQLAIEKTLDTIKEELVNTSDDE